MSRFLSAGFGAALLASTLGATASAQTAPGDRALALGREGLELYTQQRWADCAERFQAAEQLTHSPVFRLYLGRCLRGAGKLLAARTELRAVVAEELGEGAPSPWRQAKTDASAELGLLERAIPSVRFVVEGASSPSQVVRVATIEARAGEPLELDPGSHEAEARRGDGAVARQGFELAEGQKAVEVTLRFDVAQGSSASIGTATVPAGGDASGGSSGGLVPGLVLLGAGGVAASVGAVLGVMASSGYDTLRDQGCGTVGETLSCQGGPATAAQQSDFDGANTLADASTGLFIAGGVTAAVGLVVLIAFPGEDAPVTSRGGSLVWRF